MAAQKGASGLQLSQLISLSGSFAASGLAVAAVCRSSPTACAWEGAARLPDGRLLTSLNSTALPGLHESGKLVRPINSWETVVVYPVDRHLVSIWSPFYPKSLAITAIKNLLLQVMLFMEGYLETVKQAEEVEGDSDGFVEQLPPVPWRELPRRAKTALWGFMREVATATTRRILEHRAAAQLAPRLAWKLLKDMKESSLRKAKRLTRPQRVLHGWVSTYRAMTLSYTSDFLVSSAIDSCRSVHAELRAEQQQAEADALAVRRALAGTAPLPESAVVKRAAARPAPLLARRLPKAAALACRSGRLPRRVAANAMRCAACLVASSAAAGLVAAVWPGLPSVIAYNAADLAVSALVVCPGLDAWVGGRKMSRVLVVLVLGSAGMAVAAFWIRKAKS